ncbi:hypothetical protein I553_8436 [Mycobacterium xenopi 4042]|uniref:Uncharacterized protein n=1 Tax=Mycobacterium xenopi 4042 TaxID=1299334 RepID=X7ZZD0_MYCXE|nr:hypothetical protein I553_8436 [Mycobacterium xenopi 4042]
MFGDTFSGTKVGDGDWRSPVILIGTGDATIRSATSAPAATIPTMRDSFALRAPHHGSARRGISTVIPSDLLRSASRFICTRSSIAVWQRRLDRDLELCRQRNIVAALGNRAKFPRSCTTVTHSAGRGITTRRQLGICRVHRLSARQGHHLAARSPERYRRCAPVFGVGAANGRWSWGQDPTPLTPHDETWGELSLRRLPDGKWILGGFLSSHYALGYRVLDSPPRCTTRHSNGRSSARRGRLRTTPSTGSRNCTADTFFRLATRYARGVGLAVSQWNTSHGWPYRVMQFRATLRDTTRSSHRTADQITR